MHDILPDADNEPATYNVHIYREMRLRFDGITACSPEEAAQKAEKLSLADAAACEECDGRSFGALVDREGDAEHAQSRHIDFDAKWQRRARRNAMKQDGRSPPRGGA